MENKAWDSKEPIKFTPDAEPTFGLTDCTLVSYDRQEHPGSEADPKEQDRLLFQDQSSCESVRGVQFCMNWLFIPDH